MVYIDPSLQFQQPDYRIKVRSMQSISEGYAYAGTDENGSLMSMPERSNFNRLQKFSSNLYDPSLTTQNAKVVNYLNDDYFSTLNTIGITSDASKIENGRPIGDDSVGNRLFSAQHMSTSKDYQLGAKMVKSATDLIGAFGITLDTDIFDDDELTKFNEISNNSQNPEILGALDESKNAKDSESFIEQVFDYFAPSKERVTTKGKAQQEQKPGEEKESSKLTDATSTAYQAYALYETWDYLSPAQKAAGVASIGIKGYELASGTKLGKKVLVNATTRADGSELTPALTVEGAMDAFSAGLNAYSLAKNWDQLSDMSKMVYGTRTAKDIMRVGKSLGLLGKGVNSAATAANAGQLAAAGYKSVPHMGVGAMMGPASSGVPQGYTAVTYTDDLMSSSVQGGKNVIVVPKGNANTAQGVTTNAGSTLNSAIGYGSAALSAFGAYESAARGDYMGAGIQAVQAYSTYSSVGAAGAGAAGAGAAGAGAAGAGAAGAGAAGAGALSAGAGATGVGVGGGATGVGVGGGAGAGGAGAGGAGAGAGAGAGLSGAQIAGGVAGIAAGAYTIYQGWGQGGKEGAVNGAIGGASMAAGLYMLGATNPYLLAAVVVVGALSGMIKTGKHEDQIQRDSVRSKFKENGLVDDDWNVTLADGSKFDIGIDGRGGMHDWHDVEKAIKYQGISPDRRLNAYDVDYTNDVSYMASLGGVALSRMISGGAAKNVDQMGGQLTNAFISNVDFEDGELTEDKYYKIMENQRAVYSQAGIKSKSDAYGLANQLYAEGRINDFELVQMHQAFNMMYNENSYDYAMTLNAGRWNGVEVAADKQDVEDPREVSLTEESKAEEEEEEIAA